MAEIEELKMKISSLEEENKFLKSMARYYTTLGLVHCKECVYEDHGMCSHIDHEWEKHGADYFCADGERKGAK